MVVLRDGGTQANYILSSVNGVVMPIEAMHVPFVSFLYVITKQNR
jgi:hypothetical protein